MNCTALKELLEEFVKKNCAETEYPDELDKLLADTARTGVVRFSWNLLKPLLKFRLESVFKSNSLSRQANLEKEDEELSELLLKRLDLFDNPPFTIQRVCELVMDPRQHYKRRDKYMRAMEKNLMVVGTQEPDLTWMKSPRLTQLLEEKTGQLSNHNHNAGANSVELPSQSHSPVEGEEEAGPPTTVADRSQNVSSAGLREVLGRVLQEADSTTLEGESSTSGRKEKRVVAEKMECEDAQAASAGEGKEMGPMAVDRMAVGIGGRQEAAVVGDHVAAMETGQYMADKGRDVVANDDARSSFIRPSGYISQAAVAAVGEVGEVAGVPARDPLGKDTQENLGFSVSGEGMQKQSDESRVGHDRTEPNPTKVEVIRSSASGAGQTSTVATVANARTGAGVGGEGSKDAAGADEATGELNAGAMGCGQETGSDCFGSSCAGVRETSGGSGAVKDEVSVEISLPGASGRDLEGEASGAASWEDVGVRVVEEEDWIVVDLDVGRVSDDRNVALQSAATGEDNSVRPMKRSRLEGDTGEEEEEGESSRGSEEPVAKQLRFEASGENGGAEVGEAPRRREEVAARTEAGEETEVSYKEAATGQMEKVEGNEDQPDTV